MTARGVLCLFAVLATAAPAAAQTRVGAYGMWDSHTVTAADTFKAITDVSRSQSLGGGVQVRRILKGLFADVGLSQMKFNGERVFLDGQNAIKLGIPLEVTMRPVDVAAGWRLQFARVAPHVGAGLSFLSYKEVSEFSESDEDVSATGRGLLLLAGIDVSVVRFVSVGGELRYRRIQGLLGSGGVSQAFGEDDAGGISLGMRVSVGN